MVDSSPDPTVVPSKMTSETSTPAFGSVRWSGEHAGPAPGCARGICAERVAEMESEVCPNAAGDTTIARRESTARDRSINHPGLTSLDLRSEEHTSELQSRKYL